MGNHLLVPLYRSAEVLKQVRCPTGSETVTPSLSVPYPQPAPDITHGSTHHSALGPLQSML